MDSSVSKGSKMNKFAEHKLICMLQNSNESIPVPVLCKQYCDTFGHELPYKELGFVSVDEYLISLCEVTCVWCEKSNCYYAAFKPQRPSVKYQHEQMTGFVNSCRRGRKLCDVGSKHKNFSAWNEDKNLGKIRYCLVNLVRNHKDGITIPELSSLYEEKAGQKLNLYDHGFNTLYDFVDTVDELLIITKSGTDRVFWTEVPCGSKPHYSAVEKHKKRSISNSEKNLECTTTSSVLLDGFSVENGKLSSAGSRISDTVRNFFRTILKNHPEGVWASQFCQKYMELTGCYFEMQSIGYYNFITLIEDLPSIFAWKENRFSSGDFLLFDAEAFHESEKQVLQGDAFDKLSPEEKLKDVISKIRHLLSFHEEGIYLDEFFHLYKLNYGRVFNLEELGWQSLKTFLDSIAVEVPLCTVSSTKKTKVYSFHAKSRDRRADCTKCPRLAPQRKRNCGGKLLINQTLPLAVILTDHSSFINVHHMPYVPSDIVDAHAKFKLQWIPVGVDLEDFTHIYTSSITNPSHFHIQFDDGDTSGVLDQLMEDMQAFYNSDDGELYKMNDMHIRKGTICVGIYYYDRNWHRIEIQDVFCGGVEAYFVDYGSVEKIEKRDLRYLRKKFYDVPSQAVVAELANIKPCGDCTIVHKIQSFERKYDNYKILVCWDSRANDILLQNCADRRLKACIFGYKTAERIVYLYIWDISPGSKSLSVNDILVRDGYANYCNHAVDASIKINPNWSTLKNRCELVTEPNSGISSSDVTDLLSSLCNLGIDATAGYGVKTMPRPAYENNLSAASVYDHQNGNLDSHIQQILKSATVSPENAALLHLLLNASHQNNPHKNVTDVDFSNQLFLLAIIQNLLPHLKSPDANETSQSIDLFHSLLNTVNKNKGSDAPCFDGSSNHFDIASSLANMQPHSETKTVNQSLLHNATTFVGGRNSLPSHQAPVMPAEQFCQTSINKTHNSTLSWTSADLNFDDDNDQMPDFIPPPRLPSQLHCDEELSMTILPPTDASSIVRHSRTYSASPFSRTSLSHSLNSSWSSDEKCTAFRSPSLSSHYDLELHHESVSPSSCETVPCKSFKSPSERNEPDVYNEFYEYPLENLCRKIMSKSDRNVKRLFLKNADVHIIKLMGRPHISCYDVARITVGCGNTRLLFKRANEKNISRCPLKIYRKNDVELFQEIESYGIRQITRKIVNDEQIPVLAVFPLRVALDYVYALAACPEEIIEDIQSQVTQHDSNDYGLSKGSLPCIDQNYLRLPV